MRKPKFNFAKVNPRKALSGVTERLPRKGGGKPRVRVSRGLVVTGTVVVTGLTALVVGAKAFKAKVDTLERLEGVIAEVKELNKKFVAITMAEDGATFALQASRLYMAEAFRESGKEAKLIVLPLRVEGVPIVMFR